MANNRIYFVDVTNRDGVQTSRLGLAKLEKTIINLMLDDMGITQSEFGFPTTQHEINYLNGNLELVKRQAIRTTKLSGWMRGMAADVELSFKNVPNLQYVNLSQSTSEQMIQGKYLGKKTPEDIIFMTKEAVECAKDKGAKIVGVNAEDASRSNIEFLIEYAKEAKKSGADRFRYCDTLGYEDPQTTYNRIFRIAKETQMPIELHFHNDLGMATACSVMGARAAIDAGVDAYINTAINGMGERAGNADLVSCLLACLKSAGFKGKYQIDENIRLDRAWHLAKYTAYAFGVNIPINQPAVGDNAFAHESGIHADGALKDRRNYELYDFEELGRGEPEIIETGRMITTGEYGGIKGFRNVYNNLEIEFKDEHEARNILELARYANVHTQKPLTTSELRFIYYYPDIAAKIMTVSPYYEPIGAIKERVEAEIVNPPIRVI
ncbi:TPA: homocitrate synthase [Candidatus Gastranaerophilales bacterium HUM_6]|nr:pyruvate carboxyltransferase family protein [Fusobacterium sp. CAG:815]DAA89926.1 MAG TPA: homocitrate synthase [Candidatus Gastranaerophilales bacterium HUM_6]DAA93687.1 MAG TPA: homocitrate synthase [Candidatus Gastranaerophilales bacterium HUM_7]DAB02305.1 MAG TPA: homocitrate synthase [Candidatus Gastranaerophilales bacterium HUM_12]DAB07233.1 MAG TPA: homocitrate synthase [Candidatus Gastranaerophilales bacterium HUM_14]